MKYTRTYKTRSKEQHLHYWSIVIKELSEKMGLTPKQAHEEMKKKFLIRKVKKRIGRRWVEVEEPISTAKLSPEEFEKFITQVRDHSNQNLNNFQK